MSYLVEYLCCKVCGSDNPKFLGIRGNLEYTGAPAIEEAEEHMVTNVVQCRKCGFVYTNPLILFDMKKGYNNPEEYRPSADNVKPKELFSLTMDFIERYVKDGNLLLDVGCGKGEFLAVAKERGWQTYGVEPSVGLAGYSAERYNLEIKPTSIEKVGFPSSFFDVVTLNMVLEHLDNPKATLNEINRVLKRDGFLFIEVPNTDGLILKLATLYFRLNKKDWSPLLSPLHPPFHCYGYNKSSIKYLLEVCNFKVKQFAIRNSSMRGIRNSSLSNCFEKWGYRVVTKFASFIGRGDVLTLLAPKKR